MPLEKLVGLIEDKAQEADFSGAVALYQGRRALYRRAFGYADIAGRRRNKVSTRFAVASGTKFFTALGIGALIDDGKISPDSTVRDIFHRDFSFVDARATVAHFLTHASGIFDYYDEDNDIDPENYSVAIPWSKLETPSDYLPLFEGRPPKYAPGARFSYSNGGFIFLGVIIERVTGMLYREFIQQRVFRPAGTRASGYFAFNGLPPDTAFGYKHNGETNIYNLPVRGGSDGGAYTTLEDVRRLWSAFYGGRLLSGQLTREYLTPHIIVDDPVRYGYGLYISRFDGNPMYFFVGGDAGVGFDSRFIPARDLQITIVANQTDGEEPLRDVIYAHLDEV